MSTPLRASLRPVRIKLLLGPQAWVTVTGEMVSADIATTPVVHCDNDVDGLLFLAGTWAITHVPTGHTLNPLAACAPCCRKTARDLVALHLDWSGFTAATSAQWFAGLPAAHQRAVRAARAYIQTCRVKGAGCGR